MSFFLSSVIENVFFSFLCLPVWYKHVQAMNMVSANHIARDAKSCTKLGVQILKLHVTTEALGFWGTAYLHGKALQGLLLALCAWPPTSLTLHIHFFFSCCWLKYHPLFHYHALPLIFLSFCFLLVASFSFLFILFFIIFLFFLIPRKSGSRWTNAQ